MSKNTYSRVTVLRSRSPSQGDMTDLCQFKSITTYTYRTRCISQSHCYMRDSLPYISQRTYRTRTMNTIASPSLSDSRETSQSKLINSCRWRTRSTSVIPYRNRSSSRKRTTSSRSTRHHDMIHIGTTG